MLRAQAPGERGVTHWIDLPPRIRDKVDVDVSGCWLWNAGLFPGGYGQLHWNGRPARAHRVIWELLVGPIPLGMVLDHDHPEFGCSTRRCVNPAHLDLVTRRVNNARVTRNVAAAGEVCQRGHDVTIVGFVRNHCRECDRARTRRLHARYRAELAAVGFAGVSRRGDDCTWDDCDRRARFSRGFESLCLRHARQLAQEES